MSIGNSWREWVRMWIWTWSQRRAAGCGGSLEGFGKMGAHGKAGLEKRGFALFNAFILVQWFAQIPGPLANIKLSNITDRRSVHLKCPAPICVRERIRSCISLQNRSKRAVVSKTLFFIKWYLVYCTYIDNILYLFGIAIIKKSYIWQISVKCESNLSLTVNSKKESGERPALF